MNGTYVHTLSPEAAEVAASLTRVIIHTMSDDSGYRNAKLSLVECSLSLDAPALRDFYFWLDGQHRKSFMRLLLAVPAGSIYNELVSAWAEENPRP
jgi:hypothetical protein